MKKVFYHNTKGKTVQSVEVDEQGRGILYFSDGTEIEVHPDELTDDPDLSHG